MAYNYNMHNERISEEAHGDNLAFLTQDNEALYELGFDSLLTDQFLTNFSVDGTCDFAQLTESITNPVEPGELDPYLGPGNAQCFSSEYDNILALMGNLPAQPIAKEKLVQPCRKPIKLSQSVGVGVPQRITNAAQIISILYLLEEAYRARYKSDYFTQGGKTRKPRYVADRIGNHFITLKMAPGTRGVIRVDWLTIPNKSGDLYFMPYRFQQSNTSYTVQDCNPLFLEINTDHSGTMKVYLVLIKSKQDELKSLQPLKPFRPFQDAFGVPDKNSTNQVPPMTPKQLIQEFQLDKSQLAFTYCALSSDGKSCIPQWDTTVYSTVLTELPPENSRQKAIACPRCTHVFQLPTGGIRDDDDGTCVQETVTRKRKANEYVGQEAMIKDQKLFKMI